MIDIDIDIKRTFNLSEKSFIGIQRLIIEDGEALADVEDLDKYFKKALETYLDLEINGMSSENIISVSKDDIENALEAFMAYFGL